MADDSKFSGNPERSEGGPRGGRPSGGRDLGGFRIRLSDNEMQAARALQEAFQLRSTVAVLGFSVRTLAQMLEEGQLDALVARLREQGGGRPGPRSERGGGRGGERSDRRGDRPGERGGDSRQARPNPFARPSKPAPAAVVETAAVAAETEADFAASDEAPPVPFEASELEASVAPEATADGVLATEASGADAG